MLRKILRKFQPYFQHHVKKTEAQAKKNDFLIKKRVSDLIFIPSFPICNVHLPS